MKQAQKNLIEKYNVPAPRYTSYPTVPYWRENLHTEHWNILVKQAYADFGKKEGISLYIHLPYCESLCTYCGCNKRITKNHLVEIPYIDTVLKEWDSYCNILPEKPKLKGIHLGGGTPTFFAPDSLEKLISRILNTSQTGDRPECSIEGHPNNTTETHLQTLYDLGFRKVSFGIQDFDPIVQKAIHRIQPFEKVREVTETARKIGYGTVNYDLIYGLPHQNTTTIQNTFSLVGELRPDSIAFYSYAHLPKAFPAQAGFEVFLPKESEKRALYEKGRGLLLEMGYEEIGMDHFSLSSSGLSRSKQNGTLHRNFMGFTATPTKMLLGLGNSAISDIHYAYAQNEKVIEKYKDKIQQSGLAIQKGHVQSGEDKFIRNLILEIICNQKAKWDGDFYFQLNPETLQRLQDFENEGLITYGTEGIRVLEEGTAFIRNICMLFDQRMKEGKKEFNFSKAI